MLRFEKLRYTGGIFCIMTAGAGRTAEQQRALAQRIAELLERDVKPFLAMHGGDVAVAEVQGAVVTLRLEGACRGCSMAALTFQMGVEQLLVEKFGDEIESIEYA